jgi:hypothetical protein
MSVADTDNNLIFDVSGIDEKFNFKPQSMVTFSLT